MSFLWAAVLENVHLTSAVKQISLSFLLLIYEQTVCQVPRMIDNSVNKTLVSLVEENVGSN